MTQEEKAKAYDEALERAKKLLLGNEHSNTIRSYFEHIIPELRESEDERIRKMCITAVNIAASADGGLLHSEASECLAWLEEQKDKNCLACDQHLKGYIAGRKVTEEEKQKEPHYTKRNPLFDKCVKNCDPKVMQEVSNKVDEMLGKGQKPAEWSEEDKNYYDTIVRKLEVIGDDCGLSDNQIKFLREHCPSHCLEWSEEDKRILKGIIGIIDHGQSYGVSKAEMLEYLNGLQKKSKLIPGFYFVDPNGKRYFSRQFRCGELVLKVKSE